MPNLPQAIIFIILSLICGTFIDLAVKGSYLSYVLTAFCLSIGRLIFAALSFWRELRIRGSSKLSLFKLEHWLSILVFAVLGATGLYFHVLNLRNSALFSYGISLLTVHMVVVILSVLFLGERLSPKKILLILIAFSGGTLASTQGASSPILLTTMIVVLVMAVQVILLKKYVNTVGNLMLVSGALVSVLTFAYLALEDKVLEEAIYYQGMAFNLTVMVFFGALSGCANWLMLKSFKLVPLSYIGTFQYCKPIFTAVGAFILFDEIPTMTAIVGGIVVLLSLSVLTTSFRRD